MRFESWYMLFFLLLIPIGHRVWYRRSRSPEVRASLPFPKEVFAFDPTRLRLLLNYAALALAIVALARPQFSFRQTERSVSGVDIMMVMDISASMNIEDLAERPRMDIAKEVMEGFVKGRQNDRIGFVAFSGEPLTLAPPTLDYGLVLKALRDVSIGVLKDGTAIGDGLSLSVRHLRDSKAKSRVIILLTDGDNNVGQVDPATAGELAAGFGIRVYTIAIGREGRVKLPIRQKGPFGKVITTYQWFDNALNPELLEHIAKITNGKFYRVTEADALERVFGEIDRLERTEIKAVEKVRYEEAYEKPLVLALLLLLLDRILGLTVWRFAL